MREGKKVEREINQRLEELEKKAGEYLVAIPLAELREKYSDNLKLLRYFDGVRDHILNSLHRFKAAEPDAAAAQLLPVQMAEPVTDPFLPYRVNVIVDNSDVQGPPIIVETNPSYHNLFGVVEKKPVVGGYITDFTLIKAGSMSKANGGYIVLYDRDVLANAGVWEALLRVIKNRELRIEEPAAFFGWAPPQGLRRNRSPPIPKSSLSAILTCIALWQAPIQISARPSKSKRTLTLKWPVRNKTSPRSLVLSAITAAAKACAISIPAEWRE